MKKILIIRFSSIGDIVLTTPVIRCLKDQLKAEIHYISKEQFLPVLEANPYIDKIITIKHKVSEVASILKSENYDFVVDLHKNIRSSQVKKIINAPTASFDKLNIQKWLIVNLKINRLPHIHIVDRYFKAVKKLNVSNDYKGLDYFIPEKDKLVITELPEDFRDDYIAIVIGGKHSTKIYPEEKILEIIKEVDSKVILLGGAEDQERGEQIAGAYPDKIYNSCGSFSINKSVGIIQNAKLVITNDTGLMHIAAAFRKKIISIWGNTIPGFGMYPYMPGDETNSYTMEVDDLNCRPCSKIGYDKCPKKHFRCMMDISSEKILEIVNGN